jgi:hypothetical protein
MCRTITSYESFTPSTALAITLSSSSDISAGGRKWTRFSSLVRFSVDSFSAQLPFPAIGQSEINNFKFFYVHTSHEGFGVTNSLFSKL